MLAFEELKLKLEALWPDIDDLQNAIGLRQMRTEVEELDMRAAEDGFWDNMDRAQEVTQRAARLKGKIEAYETLVASYHDTVTLIELANEEEDESLLEECATAVDGIAASLEHAHHHVNFTWNWRYKTMREADTQFDRNEKFPRPRDSVGWFAKFWPKTLIRKCKRKSGGVARAYRFGTVVDCS